MRAAPAAPLLKSLDLSLQILEALDAGPQDRGVTDLAREIGVSKATAYRVLATLERHGYVEQTPSTARYHVGPRLRRFGQVAIARLDLPTEARPFMVELRDLTEDTVHLAVLDGNEAVYVAKEEGLQPVQVVSRVGSRCPAYCVATGKALLAYAEPALLDQLVDAGLVRYTDLTHASPDAFRSEVERIRKHGYAVNWGEWRAAVRGVAAPVFDGSGRVLAAIGVCSPATRLTEERVAATVPLVVDVAARLSARLSGAPRDGRSVPSSYPATPTDEHPALARIGVKEGKAHAGRDGGLAGRPWADAEAGVGGGDH